ncbi:MAG: DsrE family protein [Gammaproteobacteria bacterium]|nr:DsrE family protein [Gammaproteobacteria bacterium]
MRNRSTHLLTLLLALITLATAVWLLLSTPPQSPVAATEAEPVAIQATIKPVAAAKPEHPPGRRLIFDLATHTPAELQATLQRAESLVEGHETETDHLVLVLHGADVRFFSRKHYQAYKEIVDLAAKLDAYQIIDMKICVTAMEKAGIARDEIPPFLEMVPFGPAEIQRLIEADYIPM